MDRSRSNTLIVLTALLFVLVVEGQTATSRGRKPQSQVATKKSSVKPKSAVAKKTKPAPSSQLPAKKLTPAPAVQAPIPVPVPVATPPSMTNPRSRDVKASHLQNQMERKTRRPVWKQAPREFRTLFGVSYSTLKEDVDLEMTATQIENLAVEIKAIGLIYRGDLKYSDSFFLGGTFAVHIAEGRYVSDQNYVSYGNNIKSHYPIQLSAHALYTLGEQSAIGTDLHLLYVNYELEKPPAAAATAYEFKKNNALRYGASFLLNWNFNKEWAFENALMIPLNQVAKVGNTWKLSLLYRY
jgi:hypothetical protein